MIFTPARYPDIVSACHGFFLKIQVAGGNENTTDYRLDGCELRMGAGGNDK